MPEAPRPKRTIRKFVGFNLKFPESEVEAWSRRYDDNDEPAFAAGKNILQGNYSLDNLLVIVYWKSKRRARLVKENSSSEIEEALTLAIGAREPRTALATLTGLCGVEVPMASSILTCIDRKRYTIIDWRALEALGVPDWPITIDFYVRHYLPECSRISAISGQDLRVVDRALWGWSRYQSDQRKVNPLCGSVPSAQMTVS